MKRSLVEYPSSDDEDSQQSKKRKLPPLSSSLVLPVPIDNPARHQGRIRTTPHVEGQFAAHVYVSLTLSRRSQLYKTIQDILSDARAFVPSLHDIWPATAEARQLELHVSLSRPIFLRAHQRGEFKRVVKNVAKFQKPFQVSFTTLSELTNDEKTRTFLAMEIGAGFPEMRNLCEALSPALKSIRQQEYYTNPKFHTSIGWALLHLARQTKSSSTELLVPLSTPTDPTINSVTEREALEERTASSQEWPTISCLPQEMIDCLNRDYSRKLSSLQDGIFPVEAVTVKIGKETFILRLAG